MKNIKIEVMNYECTEYCELSLPNGDKYFYEDATRKGFTGLYFREGDIFFAIYPTEKGPIAFYEGKEYPITKDLTITVERDNDKRIFRIKEYDIEIRYTKKVYGWGWWSQKESDEDLLLSITEEYQLDKFYESYTKKKDALGI